MELYVRLAYKGDRASYTLFRFGKTAGSTDPVQIKMNKDSDAIQIMVNNSVVASYYKNFYDGMPWSLYEFHIKIDDSTGIVEIKENGILKLTYEGDTKPATDSEINYVGCITSGAYTWYMDDLAINDTEGSIDNSWCGNGYIVALKPNAVGDSSQLTGSDGDSVDNHLLVDDVPQNGDTDYVYGVTADNQDLYNLEALPTLPENVVIKRVWPEARAKDDGVGDIALVIKAGTTQDDGPTRELGTSYMAVKGSDYTLNPDDSQPWEVSDIDALQIGVKIK
jgi:hypothetical protein